MKIDRETSKKILTGYPSVDKPWVYQFPNNARELNLENISMYEYMNQKAKKNRKCSSY